MTTIGSGEHGAGARTRLAAVLDRRGVSVEQLSKRCDVAAAPLERLRLGTAEGIRFDTVVALTRELDCAVDDLFDRSGGVPVTGVRDRPRTTCRVPQRWLLVLGASVVSLVVVWVLTAVVSSVNPVDFLVYRYGAAAASAGEDIYRQNLGGPMMPPGGLPFTYTPFAALVLLPTTLLEPTVAYLLWSWMTMAVLTGVIWSCTPAGPARVRRVVVSLAVSGASIVVASHIIFGQINVPLMALCLVDVLRREGGGRARWLPSGALVGVAAAIKLTPALFLLYFAVTRQWSRLAWGAGIAAACTAIGAVVFPEASGTFFRDTVWHLSDRVDLGGLFATSGNNSIQGALAFAGAPSVLAVLAAAGAGAAGLAAAVVAHRRADELSATVIVGLTACLVSPVSWLHHWVYLVPALVLLSTRPSRSARRFVAVAAVVLLCTGPNLGDVVLGMQLAPLQPIGLLLRESLVILGAVAVCMLARRPAPAAGA
ncbi:glycosyltransferase 87 family protein [Microbacterium sp. SORGH_AS_0888]|uniref:glycosyltransferase 87 family protein n=1 Tax=Microbacterium sp. SORGH_AS_0888 TaxID=3041791 RepID=UPI0027820CBC|nr:glycosyltransferase 87 family protein [Microbacterium sp. SORGH_AS_0888]MDQ1131250.1 alpha-1,2-mannosyltransferase [Microbacterium sp. SORGH_AS_0888]